MAREQEKSGNRGKDEELADLQPEVLDLSALEADDVRGGFLAFQFKLVATKSVNWSYDD